MKKIQYILLVLFIVVMSSFSNVHGIEILIPFQATLTDSSNNPLVSDLYNIQFAIYESPTTVNSKWSENHDNVSVINGQVNVLLGHITSFPENFDFMRNSYLGISVNGQNEIAPRHRLTPAFHSYSASKAAIAGHALKALTANNATIAATTNYSPTASSAQNADLANSASHVDYATNASQLNGLPASEYASHLALEALFERVTSIKKLFVPIGSVSIFAAETPPSGYLECNGQELSKASYPDLFSVIGGIYGETENSFFLPDYRGYFQRGWNHSNTDDPSIAPDAENRLISSGIGSNGKVGDHVGTIQPGSVLPHTHTLTTGIESNDHTHSDGSGSGQTPWSNYGSLLGHSGPVTSTTGWNDSDHTHDGTADVEGPETRPINVTVMFIIKY